ncbi:MAG: hypothetical protein QF886_27025, partial [Planctomycetota bacterium]|nr:hypothetical protein [Planctomycetota bacterium]
IIDQSQDARSWNGNWTFKNVVKDSGESLGGVLTFARGNWDAEASIPFEDIGASVPKPGEIWRMNFCRDYRAKKRRPSDWTSWSPTSGRFASPDRFGYVRFGGSGPTVQVGHLGDLMDGSITVSGQIDAAQKNDATFQVSVQRGERTVLSELRKIDLTPGKQEELLVQRTLKVAGSSHMILQISALEKTTGEPIYHTRIPFTVRPSFRIDVIPLYLKGFVDVEIDATRLTDLPAGFRVKASISPAGSNSVILEKDVTGMKPGQLRGMARFNISPIRPGQYVLKAVLVDARNKTLA